MHRPSVHLYSNQCYHAVTHGGRRLRKSSPTEKQGLVSQSNSKRSNDTQWIIHSIGTNVLPFSFALYMYTVTYDIEHRAPSGPQARTFWKFPNLNWNLLVSTIPVSWLLKNIYKKKVILIIIKVFTKCNIMSAETILSAYMNARTFTHRDTRTHEHTDYTKLISCNLKQAANRDLRRMKTVAWNGKHG